MSSPPQSPTLSHRRVPSNIDTQVSSTQNGYTAPRRQSYHRRSSSYQTHPYSPTTPRHMQGSPVQQFDGYAGDETGGHGGLGSLADELRETWDTDEDEVLGEEDMLDGSMRDSSVLAEGSKQQNGGATLSPSNAKRHRRHESMYDGSDYGDDDDLAANDGIGPGLERQMAEVESLARRGLELNGSSNDNVIARVTETIRDLGNQSSIENSATRLINAHTAISTHIGHEARTVTSLIASIFSPLSPPLPSDIMETLIPLITQTLASIPHAPTTPLHSLAALSHDTTALMETLSLLSDTLHMSRQHHPTAERRLRGVRETLSEWRRENEAREEGIRYIEKGDWDRRLRERESKKVCEGVVSGFSEVCDGWRKRLVKGAGA